MCARARALVRPPAIWREGFPLAFAFFLSFVSPRTGGRFRQLCCAGGVGSRFDLFSFLLFSFFVKCASMPACLLASMSACGLLASMPACWPRCFPVACWPRCLPAGLDAFLWPAGLDACLLVSMFSCGLLASMPACWPRCFPVACWPRCLPSAGLDACFWRAWSNGIIRWDFFCLISFLYIVFLVVGFRIVVLSLCLLSSSVFRR